MPQQVEVRAEVKSNFSVGLDNPEKPTEMFIELEFRVDLKLPEKEKDLVSYLANTQHISKLLDGRGSTNRRMFQRAPLDHISQ